MVIQWQGHACFRVRGDGVRIVTDPYTPEVAGLSPIREAADIVIMSSDDDSFHSDAGDVPGSPLVLNALEIARHGGSREARGLRFDAIETRESLIHKKDPGDNLENEHGQRGTTKNVKPACGLPRDRML